MTQDTTAFIYWLTNHPNKLALANVPSSVDALVWEAWQESRKQALAEIYGFLGNHSQRPAIQILDMLGYKAE